MTYQERTTLLTVAGRLAIGDLTARYNRALETGDLGAWLSTFLPEGVLDVSGGESFAGHGALAGYFRAVPGGRVHIAVDSVVEVDAVHARQECRFLTLRPSLGTPGGAGNGDASSSGPPRTAPLVEAVGRYRDELVYERGAWYFGRRQLVPGTGRGSGS